MKKNKNPLLVLILILTGCMSLLFTFCSKTTEEEKKPDGGTPVTPGTSVIDTSYTFDKSHCSPMWYSRFYDIGAAQLTGRFNMFGFKPKFNFSEPDPTKNDLHFWVQLSTFNTGESGRDGYGKCGLGYVAITFLDSSKTKVDPKSDTAWFDAVQGTWVQTGADDYDFDMVMTFNRYRPASGKADGTFITKTIKAHCAFTGQKDFDSNNDGKGDKFRAGFIVTFSFNRSDFMDKTSTGAYIPVPTRADSISMVTTQAATKNTTYGVWSASTADKMDIVANMEFYKNH